VRATRVPRALFEVLKAHEDETRAGRLLAFAKDEDLPEARVWVLDWIGRKKVAFGFDVCVEALGPGPALVRRAAVGALSALDDPRAVKPLIEALATADGQLAVDIEGVLHRFTGQPFAGAGSAEMWAGWWRSSGPGWLAADAKRRFEERPPVEGADFYGIATRSKRIVFVLDRSESMKQPVPRRGPVSGTGRTDDEQVPGGTRLEIAKNQLARTIRALPRDTRFAVLFYGFGSEVWPRDETLIGAEPENKEAAITWFSRLDPLGGTPMFDALHRALTYARTLGAKDPAERDGADTIFLLSDGRPTTPDGQELSDEALQQEFTRFLDACRPLHCIVNTIGVGPRHDKEFMARLAAETGGEYRAVGMK
jgi:hypothetical protein